MIQRTYGDVKEQLSLIAGNTGMPVTDARVQTYCDQAIQELMNEGDFPGVVDRWYLRFDEATGDVALPSFLDRLMQITVDGVPSMITSPWYEFVQYGPGIYDDSRMAAQFQGSPTRAPNGCSWYTIGNTLDRGDSPVQHHIPYLGGPWKIRIYDTVHEADGAVCNIQGTLPSGLNVRSQVDGAWIDGEELTITNGSAFTESVNDYAKVTAFSKPVTNGYVRMTAWNGTIEVDLSMYEPNETTPSYRHYFVPRIWRNTANTGVPRVILARARRRFVPIVDDDSVLIIGNVLALQAMMLAQYHRQTAELDSYLVYKQTAVDIMRNEAEAYMGKARVPSVSFQRGFAVGGDMPSLR